MGQEYGAAQSIFDVAKNAYDKVTSVLGDSTKKNEATKVVDDSYQKEMLKRANDSFRKGAEAETAKSNVRKVTPGTKAAAPKANAQKKAPRKYISTKR